MTNGNGVLPVMILEQKDANETTYIEPLLVIGSEDDGCIRFERKFGIFKDMFAYTWARNLIADLTEAIKICDEKVKNNK